MKTIGLIGGISYHSTAVYYQLINQYTNEELGGAHAAKLLLYSVNYDDIRQWVNQNDWPQIEKHLSEIALNLESIGAECILLCCNSIHKVADEIRQKLKIPLIHIAEETGKEIAKQNIKKVGLLGSKFTMENSFFSSRLSQAGIQTIIPNEDERILIHQIIVNELAKGTLSATSKKIFQEVIIQFKKQGSEAVIFGCTEIGMMLQQEDCELPIFDTTLIHSQAAVNFSIS
jgi:aspartate racemase